MRGFNGIVGFSASKIVKSPVEYKPPSQHCFYGYINTLIGTSTYPLTLILMSPLFNSRKSRKALSSVESIAFAACRLRENFF
jgi:hypothetical protein